MKYTILYKPDYNSLVLSKVLLAQTKNIRVCWLFDKDFYYIQYIKFENRVKNIISFSLKQDLTTWYYKNNTH